jgi:hypothetical protein
MLHSEGGYICLLLTSAVASMLALQPLPLLLLKCAPHATAVIHTLGHQTVGGSNTEQLSCVYCS